MWEGAPDPTEHEGRPTADLQETLRRREVGGHRPGDEPVARLKPEVVGLDGRQAGEVILRKPLVLVRKRWRERQEVVMQLRTMTTAWTLP